MARKELHNLFSDMRCWLHNISHSVKLSYYCKSLNIKPSNLTQFMKGYDKAIQFDKLIELRDYIISDLQEKIG